MSSAISRIALCTVLAGLLLGNGGRAGAAPCQFEEIGTGRAVDTIDGRSFRLDDGREIRLAMIETEFGATSVLERAGRLAAVLGTRDLVIRAAEDTPDRYGRQLAFVFLAGAEVPVQAMLLREGTALISGEIGTPDCVALLRGAETEARKARRGAWNDSAVIKNAEIADIVAWGAGRFAVVEGRILSVRQTGAMTYLNFGRSWTQGFAATIPKRTMAAFETAGIALKSLERRRIRVRGWIGGQSAPRIEVQQISQLEIMDGD